MQPYRFIQTEVHYCDKVCDPHHPPPSETIHVRQTEGKKNNKVRG